MSAIYCSNCGAKHPYTYSAPKFCSSCGTSMGAIQQTAPSRATHQPDTDDFEDEEDDDGNTNSRSVPKLRKLDFELESFESPVLTLGAIFHQPVDPSQIAKRPRTASVDEFVNSKSDSGE